MKYISINAKVMSGEPVIIGTRIPVSRIIGLLGEGYTFDLIHENFYPHIPVGLIRGAAIEAPHLIGKMGYDKTPVSI